jgi:hypothetical protein
LQLLPTAAELDRRRQLSPVGFTHGAVAGLLRHECPFFVHELAGYQIYPKSWLPVFRSRVKLK